MVNNAAAIGRSVLVAGFLLLPPSAEAAWDFSPTATEWASWPEYCKVQYSWVNSGFAFEYADKYSLVQYERWRSTVGDKTYTHLHHYCGAIHYLTRARFETAKAQREYLVNWALENALYTFVRADPQSTVYPQIAITVARARVEKGDADAAVEVLNRAIEAQPKRYEAYGFLASVYRRLGKLTLARDALVAADTAALGNSAEVQYNLGLIELELGNVDAAVGYARKVYSRDYPLQGLRLKLQKKGRTLN